MGDDAGFQVRNVISRLYIYERIRIGFAAHTPLTNYNVEIRVSEKVGSSVISRKLDVGFRVHEPENNLTRHCANFTIFPIFPKTYWKIGKSSKIHITIFHGQIRVGFQLFEPENRFCMEVRRAKTLLFMNHFRSTVRQLDRASINDHIYTAEGLRL
jgi:hypothetical protein